MMYIVHYELTQCNTGNIPQWSLMCIVMYNCNIGSSVHQWSLMYDVLSTNASGTCRQSRTILMQKVALRYSPFNHVQSVLEIY
jgi:hypothetical protein